MATKHLRKRQDFKAFLARLIPGARLSDPLVSAFVAHLETGSKYQHLPDKDCEITEVFNYLQQTMKMYELTTVKELLDHVQESSLKTQKLMEQYQKAPFFEKIEIEKGFQEIYCIDLTEGATKVGKESFFEKLTKKESTIADYQAC